VNALDALTISQVAIGLLRQQLRRAISSTASSSKVLGREHHSESRDGTFHGPIAHERSLAELRVRINACFEAGALATGASLRIEEIGSAFSQMESDPTSCRTTVSPPKHSVAVHPRRRGHRPTGDLDGHGERLVGGALDSPMLMIPPTAP